MATNNDKIQFRGAAEKEATRIVDELRLGGINISELARQGLQAKLKETLSDEERIEIHQQYKSGELSEEVAEIRETEAFAAATDLDTDGVFQE